MADLDMSWSGDLTLSSTGDLATANDPALGTQRVLRRLMTNSGDYLWNPDYGAGLGQYVGRAVAVPELQALLRMQIEFEAAVATSPEPVISVSSSISGFFIQIRYEDSATAHSSAITAAFPG